MASSLDNGGGTAAGTAPTGSGPPALPWEPKRHLPTRGLVNVGNTCFFNSTLQNVFKARLLHRSLFGDESGRREGEYVGPVTKAFRKVLLEMKGEGPVGGRRGAYNPKALLTAVQRAHPSFRGYHQHDAHELFMRLVGTLEDEEDSCIKRRREEDREAEEEEEENEEKDGVIAEEGEEDEGATGQPKNVSGDDNADAGGDPSLGINSKFSSKDGVGSDDVVVLKGADEIVGGADGGGGEGVALPGARETGAAAAALVNGAKEASNPGVPSVPEADYSDASSNLMRGEKSAAVAGKQHGEQIPAAGGAPTEAAKAAPTSNDEQAVSSEAHQTPSSGSEGSADSDPEYGTDGSKDAKVCGCGDVGVDADTSTDDGETTDAGDHDDDDDDDNNNSRRPGAKGADALSSKPKPANSSPEADEADEAGVPAGGGDGAGKEEKAQHQDAERTAAVAPRRPVVPQCAAVTEVFGGRLCSVVTCGSCGGRSFCTEPTVCLSLEIPFRAKAVSEKGLAYIAKKKAAAAAAAAAAKAESAPAESAASGLEAPSNPGDDKVDDACGTDPTMTVGPTDESDGFVLSVSVKQKKKAARQERERQRLIDAEAKASKYPEVDPTAAPVGEDSGNRNDNTTTSTDGGGVGKGPPQDGGDEVRQCLEHVLSVCVSAAAGAAGVDGESVDATAATGVDPEIAAEQRTADDSSDVGGLGNEGGGDEGFRLSTKERKKIARQEKNERQRTMEANADAGAEGDEIATTPNEVDDSEDAGEKTVGAAAAASGGSELETADQSTAPSANGRSEPAASVSTGEGERQGEAMAALQADQTSNAERDEVPIAPVAANLAAPGAEILPPFDDKRTSAEGEARQTDPRPAPPCEGVDYEAQDCGGDPASDNDPAAVKRSGKAERGEETEGVIGDARGGREQQPPDVELRNRGEEGSDGRAFSSSGSLTGCTTGETQGSDGTGGDGDDDGSAFGSECSEKNAGGDGSGEHCKKGGAASGDDDDDTSKRLESSSDASQPQEEQKTGEKSTAADPHSASSCLDKSAVAAEGEDATAERGEGCRSATDGSVANGSSCDVRKDGTNPDEDVGGTKEGGTGDGVPPAPTDVPQSPLNRLQEPPARAKPDRRHDPIGLDLYECLDHFMAEEELVAKDGNGYDCETCTARSRPAAAAGSDGGDSDSDDDESKGKGSAPRSQQDARKRLLMLGRPPGMLVCHLKRLQARKKVIRSVEFPIELDMAPYFWRDPDAPLTPEQTRYRLTGLIQHRGRRDSGHFVAYVRDRDEWKHASDSAVRTASLPEVKACEAYMLFYERFGGEDPVYPRQRKEQVAMLTMPLLPLTS